MNRKKSNNKKRLKIREDSILVKSKRFIIVIVAMISICIAFNIAENYIKDKGELKVYINSTDVVLINEPYMKNGTLYLSVNDIDKYLNATTYSEKNSENKNTIISTSGSKIARLTEGEKEVEVNDTVQKIENNLEIKNGVYYLPVSELDGIYNLEIKKYNNIINLDMLNKEKKVTYLTEKQRLKYSDTSFSKTVEIVNKGEEVTLVQKSEKWSKVMTSDGNIGYIKTKKLEKEQIAREEFVLHNEMKVTDDEKIAEISNNDIDKDIDEIINTYDLRKKFITRIVNASIKNRLKGVKVNFDNIDIPENYYKFLTELKPYLNDYGISLIVVKKDNLDVEKLKNITNEVK